jgi:hypothetical protein
MHGEHLMLTTRGLSPRYVRDLLTRAHELLRVPGGASHAQLFRRLEIEGYNRHSLADLLSFIEQCPTAFTTIDDGIRADGTTVPEVENLGIDQAPVGPRKFESPGGSVWHLSRECEWLWEESVRPPTMAISGITCRQSRFRIDRPADTVLVI